MTTTAQIEVGSAVPDLTLSDDSGNRVALRELRGSRVVLYFYPKDDTPGCTTQACSLRDAWERFTAADDVVLYGVSPDDASMHTKFRTKHELPFPLLVDEDHRLAEAFGFWVEKSMYGKKYWGVERSTVIIDADGAVAAVARKVKPGEHTEWLTKELGL